ncbi:acid ceramidase-like protein [Heterostelium album PN500]|uniref:Acid ceramidase-like protein n=1 Tax=Heterostelium pallidum (strain ATCC 26659 / Pp 5 / PN500) TaxID=670386 RepID=D3BVM3_HETP5|nr:acid ceramidase-like protein [Heterostelium album PN500]EFA74526.1 acid ceramidase-like protein [Heterostelium album PN500]|eukprot:XP_020426660.1 acid ceramidase-like protein [Heterostelium album PN500]
MKIVIYLSAILFIFSIFYSGGVNAQCSGSPNPYPIYTEAAVLVNTSSHGKLYVTGPSDNLVNILNVYGTAYQRGFAHGSLMKAQVDNVYADFFGFITEMVNELVKKYADYLPLEFVDLIEKAGIGAALDLTAVLTKDFTPQHFFDEMQGLADGSGIPYKTVLRLHMFPELIKAACSMIGAWGGATANSGLLQLRALDFNPEAPLRYHPVVIVSHPTDGGNTFSSLAWAGFIGTMTGYSQRTAICEKYWFAYNGTSSRSGTPWHFLLRDILQYDSSIDDALNRIYNAHRTCSIYVGLGSNTTNDFRAVEYSHQVVRVFDDQTPFPAFAPQPAAHPLIPEVVYIDKHVQPSNDACLSSVLQKQHGAINVQTYIDITGLAETGDLHAAVYDFTANQMYVSVASQDPSVIPIIPAYQRQFLQIDLEYFFNESFE